MKPRAILFDLGNTLAAYWSHDEWLSMLEQAINACQEYLQEKGQLRVPAAEIPSRVQAERGDTPDYSVIHLIDRLQRVFDLQPQEVAGTAGMDLCRAFMKPLFARGKLYADTIPTLKELQTLNICTAILSNSPWGSPSSLWHQEIERLGLTPLIETAAFCGEVGYRKPAPDGFRLLLERLSLSPGECIFVGDDPRWDIAGPEQLGMPAVLINREDKADNQPGTIHNLNQLLEVMEI